MAKYIVKASPDRDAYFMCAAGEHIAGVFDSYEDAIAAALKIKGQTRATEARFGEALALGDL